MTISVSDTGIGIPKDKLSAIFQRFEQATRNISGMYGGSGLGLSICKELAEGMLGELSVESECKKGSTFSITLPVVLEDVLSEDGHLVLRSTSKERGLRSATHAVPVSMKSSVDELETLAMTARRKRLDSSTQASRRRSLTIGEDAATTGQRGGSSILERQNSAPEVLIVEDNKMNAKILQKFLQKLMVRSKHFFLLICLFLRGKFLLLFVDCLSFLILFCSFIRFVL